MPYCYHGPKRYVSTTTRTAYFFIEQVQKDKYVITQDMYGKILTILQQPKGAKYEEGSNLEFL